MSRPVLRARHAVVVAPHPDDEAIGVYALLRRLAAQGARLEVVVVSDGAASHPRSRRWPPYRLARERRRETRRAMATLAIRPPAIRFLGLADGTLEKRPREVALAVARAFRRRRWPDLIVGPAGDDEHGDHRAVAQALARMRRRGERRLGYRVWPVDAPRRPRDLSVRLDARALAAKRRVVRGYRTQGGMIDDAEAGFAMTPRHLNAFAHSIERFERLA